MGKVNYIITKGYLSGKLEALGEAKVTELGIFIYVYPKIFINPKGIFLGKDEPFKFHLMGGKATIPGIKLGGEELPIYSSEKFMGTLYGSPAIIGVGVFAILVGGELHFAYFPPH